MAKIKCSLDTAISERKNISVVAIETQLDFLVSKLFNGNKQTAREFYNELIKIIGENSVNDNKDEIIAYLKKRLQRCTKGT